MNPEQLSRADRILEQALDLEPDDRAAFVRERCGRDGALLALVQALVASAEEDDATPLPGGSDAEAALQVLAGEVEDAPRGGERIGPYRLVREIGRGGMAVVYLAERADGGFDQQVAIKLIRERGHREDVLRRFERERQVLARIAHPHIARLFDGGTTDDGQPYFVMEYIEGVPIDRHCDEQELSIGERLTLYRQAVSAVAYAHRNLVVHRDIKPSNILVGHDGTVRLLDFGIAGELTPATESSELTADRPLPMTPAWASPEQIRGNTVTTASDIYQLGLLLYQLLTGRSPYRPASDDVVSMANAILDDTPTRPSQAALEDDEATEPAAARSARRRATPAALRRSLAGDLDKIQLKALAKDPDRRYSSAAQLDQDIENYLQGLPVSARADSLWYRLSKVVRRHRVATALALLSVASLAALALISTLLSLRLADERDRANVEARTAEEVSDFMIELFRVSDPGENRGESLSAREILDRGSERIDRELGGQPETQAAFKSVLGRVYQNLGSYEQALPMLEDALALRRERHGIPSLEVAESLDQLGWLLQQSGEIEGAEALIREGLSMRQAILGEGHPSVAESRNNLALLLHKRSRYEEAIRLYREALAAQRDHFGGAHVQVANTLSNLGLSLMRIEQLDEARTANEEALAMRRELLGGDHPDVAISLDNLGQVHRLLEDPERGIELMREALEIRKRVFGDRHPAVGQSLNNVAVMSARSGDLPGATEMFLELLAIDRETLGEQHPDFALSTFNVGILHRMQDLHEDALPYFRDARSVFLATYGDDHEMVARCDTQAGDSLRALGRLDEGEGLLLSSYDKLVDILGPAHAYSRTAAEGLARLYETRQQTRKAALWQERATPPEADTSN
ncbi:hypothetical protein ABI59_08840 [Acidobacteria bacterium Mor1]|nr:hypothetical protein ABI59_08840 [Acidobacteria bacterium Mor1]